MDDNNTILFELDGHVARITLNRPKVYNSFNREMALSHGFRSMVNLK